MKKQESPFNVAKYKGQWVAFRPGTNKVVGSGPTLPAAEKKATERGVRNPEFYRVPRNPEAYFAG